jgi:hypothetical protein
MKAAYAMHDLVILALALEAEEICAGWGIGRFDLVEEPGIFNSDVFDKADWDRLAELAGEPVDIQACKLGPANGAHHQLKRRSGFFKRYFPMKHLSMLPQGLTCKSDDALCQ